MWPNEREVSEHSAARGVLIVYLRSELEQASARWAAIHTDMAQRNNALREQLEDEQARVARGRQEIEMLESCLNASNLQHNNLATIARNACNVLQAIVDGAPLPITVLAAYDALYDELNPPECE